MQTTYTIASANGSTEIVHTDSHADGSKVISKAVAYKDGTFKCFRFKNGKWANFSRGAMAAKRFGWAMNSANQYFAN